MIFKKRSPNKPGFIKKVSKDYQINRWIGYSNHKENIKKILSVTMSEPNDEHKIKNFEQQMHANGLSNKDIKKKARQQKIASIILFILGAASILYLIYHAMHAEYNGVILCSIICIVCFSQALTAGLTSYRLKKRSLTITLATWLTGFSKER